jgi:hypothetical protein
MRSSASPQKTRKTTENPESLKDSGTCHITAMAMADASQR